MSAASTQPTAIPAVLDATREWGLGDEGFDVVGEAGVVKGGGTEDVCDVAEGADVGRAAVPALVVEPGVLVPAGLESYEQFGMDIIEILSFDDKYFNLIVAAKMRSDLSRSVALQSQSHGFSLQLPLHLMAKMS